MSDRGAVGPVARALGFAGLSPQVAVVIDILGRMDERGVLWTTSGIALIYAAIILSFLGGMWWSIAMRREVGQGWLATIAVIPSLVGFGSFMLLLTSYQRGWPLIVIGSAIISTLIVDRHLIATGEAPDGWWRLRVPLSLGLGGLTITAGVLLAA